MKELRYKLFGGLILLLVFCSLFYRVQFAGNASLARGESTAEHRTDVYEIAQMLEKQTAQQAIVEEDAVNDMVDTVQLYGQAVYALEGRPESDRIRSYLSGQDLAVLHTVNGALALSENMPAGLRIDQKELSGEKGWFTAEAEDGKTYVIYYCALPGDSCFLYWEDIEKSRIFQYIRNQRASTIRMFEDAQGIYILEFLLNDQEDMSLAEPIYAPEDFSDYHTAKDFGITPEMLYSAAEIGQEPLSSQTQPGPSTGETDLTVGDVQYECYFRKTNGGETVTVFMIPSNRPVAQAAERTTLLLAVFAIVGFSFLVWALSIFYLVIRHNLDDEQKQAFFPHAVYARAVIYILSGMLAVAGISIFLQCLFASFHVNAIAEETLRAMDARLASDKAMEDVYQSVRMENYEASAEAIGLLSLSEEEPITPAVLDSACAAVGADFAIIYDETGAQVMSNTPYTALTLAGGGEDMQDFSRLLKGVSPISKARVTDAQTTLTHSVFGVSLPRNGNEGGALTYWAMLLFVNPKQITSGSTLSMDAIMQSVDPATAICFGADPESGRVLSSSRPDYIGKDIFSLGLPQEALRDRYMGFFWMSDARMYGYSVEIDGVLYYYVFNPQQNYQNIPQNTARAVLAYLILMTGLAAYLFFGYRKTFERYADKGEVLEEAENLVLTPSGQVKVSVDPTKRWAFSEFSFGRRAPIRNALNAGQLVYIIFVVATTFYVTQIGLADADSSAVAYLLSDRWTKGFNLFALANILFLLIAVSSVAIVCKGVISAVARYIGTKGETIGRLLMDFIGYLSYIVFAYFALYYIGIDAKTLVASLGIITFALSLGAQDLVKDILAGLSIVIDGTYQVGDIIDINGFRGTVQAVGVRTTKVEGRGGNILIVGNRDVKSVINRTRKNSWYVLEVNIADNSDLSKVEALLAEHLPQIGREIPEIISGPFYKGVVSMGRGAFCLSIIAECTEADYHKVQRKLNGAIAIFFEKHGVSMK